MIEVRGKAGDPGTFDESCRSCSGYSAGTRRRAKRGARLSSEAAEDTRRFRPFRPELPQLDELLDAATRLCANGLIARYCKVLEYLREQNRFLVRAGVGWHDGVVGHATIGADLESPAGFAFKTARSVISNHLQSESRFRTPQLLEEHGIKRAINVVIAGGADTPPFGVLEADSAQEGRFEEADLAFMQGFANLLGVAIDRHRADQQRLRSEQHLRTIVEHAPQKMWVNQADGSVLQFNKAWCDYTGHPITPEGLGWTEAIHPDDRPRMVEARSQAIASEKDTTSSCVSAAPAMAPIAGMWAA